MTPERLAEVRALAESVFKEPLVWEMEPSTAEHVVALAAGCIEVLDGKCECIVELQRDIDAIADDQKAIGNRIAAFVTAAVASATDSARLALELQLCQGQRDAARRSAAESQEACKRLRLERDEALAGVNNAHGHIVMVVKERDVARHAAERLVRERDEAIAQRDAALTEVASLRAELYRFADLCCEGFGETARNGNAEAVEPVEAVCKCGHRFSKHRPVTGCQHEMRPASVDANGVARGPVLCLCKEGPSS